MTRTAYRVRVPEKDAPKITTPETKGMLPDVKAIFDENTRLRAENARLKLALKIKEGDVDE